MSAMHQSMAVQQTAGSLSERLAQRDKMLREGLAALKKTEEAVDKLYGVLSADQKKVADGIVLNPVAKWISRARARGFKSGQPKATDNNVTTYLAMAAPPTAISAGALVPRARQTQRRAPAQDDDRGAGAKAAGGALEVCDRRRRH